MSIDQSELLEDAKHYLTPQQLEGSMIFLNKRILSQGEQVKVGLQIITMPFEGILIFVDLSPRTNWAHPCLYILVDNKTHQAKLIESSFPPNMNQPGDNYVVILRFGKKPFDEHDFNVFANDNPQAILSHKGGEKT